MGRIRYAIAALAVAGSTVGGAIVSAGPAHASSSVCHINQHFVSNSGDQTNTFFHVQSHNDYECGVG